MFTLGEDKVALVTDSSCDLSDEQLKRYDIRLVPLRLSTSRGDMRDRLDIQPAELYEIMKTELPKTSLPQPGDVSTVLRQLLEEGCTRVLYLSISSGLSGACNLARIVTEDFSQLRIDVVDSKTLSCGLGLLVLEAAEVLDRGETVEAAVARVKECRKNQLGCFVIRTLEYLRKGGRIGLVEGVVGSLLQIKPVIFVNPDGVYQTLVKARGFTNALNAMKDELVNRYKGKKVRLAVVHGGVYDEAVQLEEYLKGRMDVASSFISPVSPCLAIHTGPGLLGAIVQYA